MLDVKPPKGCSAVADAQFGVLVNLSHCIPSRVEIGGKAKRLSINSCAKPITGPDFMAQSLCSVSRYW